MKTRLVCFTVKGFRNFPEPVSINFADVRDYKFNQECINDGIITKMGIYGPNGSGKSNIGIALFNIVQLLTDKSYDPAVLNPGIFLNVDEKREEAVFIYEFSRGNERYVFEYHKVAENVISREILTVNGDTIYDYDFKTMHFNILNRNGVISDNLNFEYLNSNLSILRYIANNAALKDDSPIRTIMDFVSGMLWFRSVRENSFIGLVTSPVSLDDWIINNGLIGDFNSFLKNTCDLDVHLKAVKTPDNKHILVEEHENGVLIFQQVYSSGTSAAELFYYWMKSFDKVSLLFMDEFDAYYHFALARKIFEQLKKYTDMQVIFTTHNTALLGNDILRPDCYFILGKGKLRSYIDSTGGREIREGHNLEKIYRNGGLNG